VDKTWAKQNNSLKIFVAGQICGGLEVKIRKGSRIIVCHADSDKTGFIKEVRLIFLWYGK
jgi:hypothetical protein